MSHQQRRSSSEYSNSSTYASKTAMSKPDNLTKDEQLKARGQLYKLLFTYPMAYAAAIPSILFGAVPICSFLFFGKILNEHTIFAVQGINTMDKIKTWCLCMTGMAVLAGILRFLLIFLWVRMGSRFTQDLKGNLFESLMRNEVGFFDVTSIGGILTLLGEDTQLVQDNFGTTKGTQCQNLGQFLSGIILAYVYSWKLALIATCVFPYSIFLIMTMSKCIDYHINKRYMYTAKLMTMSEETLAAIRTVRGFNQEDHEYERFMEITDNVVEESVLMGRWVNVMMTLVMLGVWSVIIGNMYYGGQLVEKGELQSGDLMSVFGFMMFGTMGIIELQTSMQAEQKAIGSGARILKMIEHIPSIPFSGGETIKDFKGHIIFQNVSFKYPTRDVYVLKNVSFEIKAGEMGALVGHSGSGKSTCVQLLERYYDATEGVILLDGHDITTLDPRWLHQNIGLVSQEPTLFQTSILENIKYARQDATFEEVENAAEMANAKKFIEKLNKGYDFYVGEKGSMLSGGQRQRIAIARALIKDPVILMTDEATSALDAGSEKKVQAALDKIMATRTSVVVAHRLTTVKNANIIYVFDTGEIVEVGKHEELVAKKGVYYELVKRQLKDVDKDVEVEHEDEEEGKEEKKNKKSKKHKEEKMDKKERNDKKQNEDKEDKKHEEKKKPKKDKKHKRGKKGKAILETESSSTPKVEEIKDIEDASESSSSNELSSSVSS